MPKPKPRKHPGGRKHLPAEFRRVQLSFWVLPDTAMRVAIKVRPYATPGMWLDREMEAK